ncbi:MAG: lipoyl synthase [Treponema sp.]|nr:lipoyl synthase [Treponema sp.]
MTGKPEWLRVRYSGTANREIVEKTLASLNLNTVCVEANCPNYAGCFSRKTATFMIMGTDCTRDCRFCNVRHGLPRQLDPREPGNVAQAVKELELKYVVVTSVTRDDLPDGGAGHFARVILAIKQSAPETVVEVLIPDFKGSRKALETVLDACPAVVSHNMETVKSLYPKARPQAQYTRSLELLKNIKRLNPLVRSKSGIMLGLGETPEEIYKTLDDLREAECEFLTIGQYLAPSKQHLPVREYVEPQQFEEYGLAAKRKGFAFVASAPLVRSSFNAGQAFGL